MINAINTGTSMPTPPTRSDTQLTDEQQSLLSETLSQFDPDNLSEADALNIVDAFSEAGIQPGKNLESAMADLGFDAKTVGDLAHTQEDGNRPPPPPKQSTEEISTLIDYLTEQLEEKLAANGNNALSDKDKQSIYAQVLEKFGMSDKDSIINTTA